MNRLICCLLTACLGVLLNAGIAEAQRKYVVTPNYGGVQSSTGGYHPVELSIATADGRKVSSDVRFNLCLRYGQWREQTTVSTPLTIKAGTSKATGKLLFDCSASNGYAMIWVERDMNRRRDSRDLYSDTISQGSWGADAQSYMFLSSTVKPAVLVPVQAIQGGVYQSGAYVNTDIGKDLPSFEELASLLSGNPTSPDKQFALTSTMGIDTAPLDAIPDNWVELSTIQHVVISLPDLQNLAKDHPDKITAMKKWMAAGGRLVVNGCGEQCKNASQIQRALGIPNSPRSEWSRLKKESFQAFRGNKRFGNGDAFTRDFLSSSRGHRYEYANQFESISVEADSQDNFFKPMVLAYGQGQIVAVEDDMTAWNKSRWLYLLMTMELASADFHAQIGGSILEKSQVSEKKIPGVKEPPQSAFQLLILCFVVVVGPLNYFILRRIQRLNVLLISVPVISLFACFLLFSYAFFVQGFGFKIRHDSVTFLDQRNNVAVNRGMHSVYCGLNPGRYTFPEDRLVFVANNRYDDAFVRMEDGKVSYSGGAIQARTPHQVSTTECYDTDAGLRFKESDGNLQVRSDFEDYIECLLISYEGKFYHVEELAPGAVGDAKQISETELKPLFESALNEIVDDERFRRNFRSWGFNNHISDGAEVGPLKTSNIYMAVFEEFNGAEPLRSRIQTQSGSHVVVGRW